MKKRFLALVLAGVLSMSLLTGCSTGDNSQGDTKGTEDTDQAKEDNATEEGGKEGLKVGFCPMDLSNPFFALMASSAKEEAEKQGVELVVTDGQSDAQKQVTALENYISQGCDAIYVVPVDEESLKATIKDAEDKGIPVITHTTKYEEASAFISIDETDMGKTIGGTAGKWMADTFGEDAEVEYAILNQPTLPQIIHREEGIQAGIKEYAPNAKCVTTVAAWLPDMGMEAAETILQAYPNVKAIIGINDSGALGAYETCVASNVGDEFFIGGVDGTETAIKNIKEGTIYRGTVDIGPVPTGQMAVQYAVKLVNNEEVPKETMVEVKPITEENAEEYLKLFE